MVQQIAKGGGIIIGERTYQQTEGRFRIRKRGGIAVKHRTDPVICYEVLR